MRKASFPKFRPLYFNNLLIFFLQTNLIPDTTITNSLIFTNFARFPINIFLPAIFIKIMI